MLFGTFIILLCIRNLIKGSCHKCNYQAYLVGIFAFIKTNKRHNYIKVYKCLILKVVDFYKNLLYDKNHGNKQTS